MKILLACIVILIYILTSPPTVTVGDSGEFITAASTLGIPHPPGYPLYCLIGKLFSSIPFSNHAWRVSFASMFFSGLAVIIVFLLLKKLTENDIASFVGSIIFALNRVVWSQSIISEVYALNVFFVVFCLYLLFLWNNAEDNKYLYLFALVFGLSLGNHYPLMILASVGFVLLIVFNRKLVDLKVILLSLCFVILGISVYLYLPVRSAINPPVDWGNPQGLIAFFNHVLRQQYRSLELGKDILLTEKIKFLKDYSLGVIKQFNVFLIPVFVGIWISFKKCRNYFWVFSAVFLTNSVLLIYMLQFEYNPERLSIVNVYYLPSYMILCLWLGIGLKGMLSKSGVAVKTALLLLVLVSGLFNVASGFQLNYQRDNFLAYDFAKNIVSFLEKDSVLFIQKAGDESLFTTLYLQKVRGVRNDLKIYDCWGNVFENIYGDGFNIIGDKTKWLSTRKEVESKIIRANPNPTYYLTFLKEDTAVDLPMEKTGLVYRVKNKTSAKSYDSANLWNLYNLRGTHMQVFSEYQERELVGVYSYIMARDYLERGAAKNAVLCLKKAAGTAYDINWLLNNIGLLYYRNGFIADAKITFLSLLDIYPDYDSGIYNLGLVYKAEKDFNNAEKYFMKYIEHFPEDMDAYRELSDVYWVSNKRGKARKIYESVLKNNMELANSYIFKGAELYKSGKNMDAIDEWERVLLINPDYSIAYYNIGVAYMDLKLYDKAKKYLKTFLEIEPDGQLKRRVDEYIKVIQ
ncbi:MAG: DUF2723 domain-containing protein [Endomicrobiales bacterium]|nr:DUF2723 domain-containing protein [Endomicrobiales bacterium]